jgi:hypothetical protein
MTQTSAEQIAVTAQQIVTAMSAVMAMSVSMNTLALLIPVIGGSDLSWVKPAWAKLNAFDRKMMKTPAAEGWNDKYYPEAAVTYDVALNGKETPAIPAGYKDEIRLVMAGYYLIATEQANHTVISDVYKTIDNAFRRKERTIGLEEDERKAWARFSTGMRDSDMVIDIDSVMSEIHAGGEIDIFNTVGSWIGHLINRELDFLLFYKEGK